MPRDETPRIAVLGVLPTDINTLQDAMTETVDHRIGGMAFTTGLLSGKAVVLGVCGISMVNAAMNAQRTLDLFEVSQLMVTGVAGGADPDLNAGDVFVASQWGQYLDVVMGREGPAGFEPASGPPGGFGSFGMMFPRPVMVADLHGEVERRFWFPVAPTILTAARRLAVTVMLSKGAGAARLDKAPRVIVGGNGVSGAAMVNNAELRDWVFATFQAGVLDGESAAVAHVAWSNGKPFVAVRGLASPAGAGEGDKLYAAFNQLAADNAAAVTLGLIRATGA